ncbi:MAG: aminotransferase class I/II-fold pyridoxal phosphate-dependent enzyme [Chitinophagaceae bacterium]|nr:aminotransferase class I/II-fold pyridoxal phosphate-dependent enzyme [Chitinophagaceae bacterium]
MDLQFGSVCVRNPDTVFKNAIPHMESIVASTTFSYDDPEALMEVFLGEQKGFVYSRWSNPTIELAEQKVAALEACGINDEQGKPIKLVAHMFSSGMAAISTLFLANLKTGDKVLAQENLYGGTSEFLNKFLAQHGVEPILMDLKDLNGAAALIQSDSKIKMLYIETPSNPTIDVYDIEALTRIAKQNDLIVAVDNTFASPYLQQPYRFGVDFVVHSTTKYINGHGNSISGMLISREDSVMNKSIFDHRKLLGSNSNAFDAWLLLQGVKTLEIRMQRHCANAMKVAEYLSTHPKISKVNYAGLPSHRDHETAKKQMRDFSGMLSFELKDGLEAGKELMRKIQLCKLAVSLGTVDTIIQHPATMSHVGVAKAVREQYGITDGLVRLSVGIEDVNDLIADFEQALE